MTRVKRQSHYELDNKRNKKRIRKLASLHSRTGVGEVRIARSDQLETGSKERTARLNSEGELKNRKYEKGGGFDKKPELQDLNCPEEHWADEPVILGADYQFIRELLGRTDSEREVESAG